jgi:hypothetical protein
MENRSETPVEWLMNKDIKTVNFRLLKSKKESSIIKEIRIASEELDSIRQFFNSADPELIDYAIYMEKAAITRLSYLFRKAKEELKYTNQK